MTSSLWPRVLLAASAGVVLFLGWYLAVLIGRTDLLAHETSIGLDVVMGFHALGIAAATVSALAQLHLGTRRGWAVVLAACAIEGSFLLLNAETVWEYRKEEPAGLGRADRRPPSCGQCHGARPGATCAGAAPSRPPAPCRSSPSR